MHIIYKMYIHYALYLIYIIFLEPNHTDIQCRQNVWYLLGECLPQQGGTNAKISWG